MTHIRRAFCPQLLCPQLAVILSLVLMPYAVSAAPKKGAEASSSVFIDAVVASVNGKPITLREVSARLPNARKLTIQEASRDPEVRYVLDALILEHLIRAEAQEKKIGVSSNEVQSYIVEVAQRNNLSEDGFYEALKKEGLSQEQYRRQVEMDILRSKIASSMMRGGVGVSDQEIDAYLEEHPELSQSGTKLKLRQIFLVKQPGKAVETRERIQELQSELEDGESFEDLARKYSQGNEALEGGLLGVIAEEDLSSQVFDAVFTLDEETPSDLIETAAGFHIFYVDERYQEDNKEQLSQMRKEIRETLEQEKLQDKMQSFFSSELYKLHAVERKL